ncbi:MAG: putative phage abortive infection protein [Propionivibrio sp.]
MKAEDTTAGHRSHWLVLLVGILAAVLLWIWWLFDGMDRAHKVVLARAAPASAMSQPLNTKASASAAPLMVERGTTFTELGQTGDSFGSLNALLTAIAGALVFWAGFMQHQMLKQAREEAQKERANRQIQEFESLFFRLLELTATAVERIEGPKRKDDSSNSLPRHNGTRALDSLARSLFNSVGSRRGDQTDRHGLLAALVEGYLTRVYDRQPSAFGPYLRLLYQTFKHIAESALSESQQIRYANIARGQISEGAVLLLAVNGLTPTGNKFIPLIEKFGLLEHLHRRYRTECQSALGIGYRPRAFLGSKDRARPGNEWHEDPLLPERYFENLEARREEADNEAEFAAGFYGEATIDE